MKHTILGGLAVVGLLALGALVGTVLWQGYSTILHGLEQQDAIMSLPHRQPFELDPQGHGENLGRDACKAAGRIAYIDDDGFFIECLRERTAHD